MAWSESPSLAIELVNRFSMASVHQEVRWLLLNFPARAISNADALPILFGGELPSDVRFQLKVRSLLSRDVAVLTPSVLTLLGTCKSCHRHHLFPASIQEPPVLDSIRNESLRVPLSRRNLLLCSPDRSKPSF